MTDNSKIGVAKDGLVHNLHYISNAAAADRLSCPVNHSLACFYRHACSLHLLVRRRIAMPDPSMFAGQRLHLH